jgi:hypothetical protein
LEKLVEPFRPMTMNLIPDLSIQERRIIELPEQATSLTFLQAIYRSADYPLKVRLRAAALALPFEHPRLSLNAQLTGTATAIEAELRERVERNTE